MISFFPLPSTEGTRGPPRPQESGTRILSVPVQQRSFSERWSLRDLWLEKNKKHKKIVLEQKGSKKRIKIKEGAAIRNFFYFFF